MMLKRPKSKKWARRRKVKIKLISDSGWHTTLIFSWDDYELMVNAARSKEQSVEEWFIDMLDDALRRINA